MAKTPLAWDLGQETERANQMRWLDFFLVGALVFDGIPLVVAPLNELAFGVLALLALTRRPDRKLPLFFPLFLVGLVGVLGVSAFLNDVDGTRRLLHMVLYAMTALFIASGRVHLRSASWGLVAGLVVNLLWGLIFIATPPYPGRLVGFIMDPNATGFIFVTLGAVALSQIPPGRWRVIAQIMVVVAVVATFSRTSLLALALGYAWLLLGHRIHPLLGTGVLGGLIYGIANLPDDWVRIGPWAERTGSDLLRERILIEEQISVAQSPLYGNGPGTAMVDLGGNITLFFHSSYLGLRAEGGWLAFACLMALLLIVFWRLLWLSDKRSPWLEVAIIVLMTCATNIGEAFLTLQAAVVLGFSVRHLVQQREEPDLIPAHCRNRWEQL